MKNVQTQCSLIGLCSETQNNMAGSTISSTDKYEFPKLSEIAILYMIHALCMTQPF